MTDTPPSEQPAQEPVGDQPAAAGPPPAFNDVTTDAAPGGLAAAFPPDRPERAVGAAFAGGMVLALILKRLAR